MLEVTSVVLLVVEVGVDDFDDDDDDEDFNEELVDEEIVDELDELEDDDVEDDKIVDEELEVEADDVNGGFEDVVGVLLVDAVVLVVEGGSVEEELLLVFVKLLNLESPLDKVEVTKTVLTLPLPEELVVEFKETVLEFEDVICAPILTPTPKNAIQNRTLRIPTSTVGVQ
jgi:hypothetical protein